MSDEEQQYGTPCKAIFTGDEVTGCGYPHAPDCDNCLARDGRIDPRTGKDPFPTAWFYDGDNRWITRMTGPGDGEIAMQFTKDGVPDDEVLFAITRILNGDSVAATAAVASWAVEEIEEEG